MLFAGLVVASQLAVRPAPVPVLPEAALKPVAGVGAVQGLEPLGLAPRVLSPGVLSPAFAVPAVTPLATGLELVTRRIEAVGRNDGLAVKASLDGLWEAEQERSGAEEYVYVNREPRKAQAREEMRAEIPPLDQLPQAFSKAGAEEFAALELDLGGRVMTGREVLALLLTPYAIVDGFPPDPRSTDFAGFGLGEQALRALAEEGGFSVHRLHQALRLAHREGLVYRLHDTLRGRTYYGVTHDARAALGLTEPPREARPPTTVAEGPGPLEPALAAVRAAVAGLSPKDELVEFAAELEETRDDPQRFGAAVLTLLESAHGTGVWEPALALAEAAVGQGAVSRAELDQVLSDL